MNGLVDWAASRARMVLAFIALSLAAGTAAYVGLPKEGEPDIEIPAIFVSVPFPGISAADSETLLVKPMETQLADLDGLNSMSSTASEGYAGIGLEFDFGWDKTQILADIRDAMKKAEAEFPAGAENYSINEINFSEFPIIIVNLTGNLPERTLVRVAKDLQDRLESLDAVLEAGLAGQRDEMLEVVIDPLRLESYNVTANELISVVTQNNLLIAAGEIDSAQGSFAVKIPSSFDDTLDVYNLPVKMNGDRVVTLGDLATISLTFEDRVGTARFNGTNTVALQVVKRKGFNLIDTVDLVKSEVAAVQETWPEELRRAIDVGTSNDQSVNVDSMVTQLEGSVLTAIALVMVVVLAALGLRAALLVGFAIPTSFLLCFALLAVMEITISNIVMFGLILAVGMLVDGAIVVVEYADKRIKAGSGPMTAYTEAAKRMFWPIVSSTGTTLCAFLPMLFWPGVPGQFMGMLPVTLIFVLSASLVVALVYLPVLGGVTGRLTDWLSARMQEIAAEKWYVHLAIFVVATLAFVLSSSLNPIMFGAMGDLIGKANPAQSFWLSLPVLIQAFGAMAIGVTLVAIMVIALVTVLLCALALFTRIGNLFGHNKSRDDDALDLGYQRSWFGRLISLTTGNPIGPVVSIGVVFVSVLTVFLLYGANNRGTEFFVETEPEQAIIYVQARGNLSLEEKDALVKQAEDAVITHPAVQSAFAFAGAGGLNSNTGGAEGPADAIGQVQIELIPWAERPVSDVETTIFFGLIPWTNTVVDPRFDGDVVIADLEERLRGLPGIRFEILNLAMGPASAKPVHLRIKGNDWDALLAATELARTQFEATPGLAQIEDTLPLPGIDWQIDVDVEAAGRYGADVATVGGMVQLVTRGILLDTFTPATGDEEIEIRVRLPEEDRVLSTLDSLKVRTNSGLVPLSNFITRTPVQKLAEINRIDQVRYFDVKSAVDPDLIRLTGDDGTDRVLARSVYDADQDLQDQVAANELTLTVVNDNERIQALTQWLETDPFPPTIEWEWTGDQEDQEESGAFLAQAGIAALGLMFIILLAQFNSLYNSLLVLCAVVLSTVGTLIGMMVMNQPFSIIMTGTGIVALAGIVVNNNIILIDTYQEYSQTMPRKEAILRTAQDRIRPVLLTTITTMAGLAPMMFGLSLDFFNGGYTIDSPTALWWKQLATAVVFGLGIATVLTLVFTPSMLALRVWAEEGVYGGFIKARALASGKGGQALKDDLRLNKTARSAASTTIIWEDDASVDAPPVQPLRAAE